MEHGVVVGYDQTPSSERAIDEAAGEAARRGVALTVVHVSHRPEQDVAEQGAGRARNGRPELSVRARSETGSVPTVLAELSSDADLLVVGHRGHGGFAGLQLGSVALRSVTRAGCPVVVVRGAGDGPRGTVLAAVDVGDFADEILEFAFAEAAQRGARLKAVGALEVLWPYAYAGDHGELDKALDQTAERAGAALAGLLQPWRAKYPDVDAESELLEGAPSEILTDATTYADLIVVGARRRGEGRHRMHVGPIAHTLLLHADCPVAVVPHD